MVFSNLQNGTVRRNCNPRTDNIKSSTSWQIDHFEHTFIFIYMYIYIFAYNVMILSFFPLFFYFSIYFLRFCWYITVILLWHDFEVFLFTFFKPSFFIVVMRFFFSFCGLLTFIPCPLYHYDDILILCLFLYSVFNSH